MATMKTINGGIITNPMDKELVQSIGNIQIYKVGELVQIEGYVSFQYTDITVKQPYTLGVISDSSLCPAANHNAIGTAWAYRWTQAQTYNYTPAMISVDYAGNLTLIPMEINSSGLTTFMLFLLYKPT